MAKRARQLSPYEDWVPPDDADPKVLPRFAAQLSEMTLLYADKVLHPELASTFRGLLAELRTARPLGAPEVLRAKRDRAALVAARDKVLDIRREVDNFRGMVARNAVPAADAFATVLRDLDDLTAVLYPPLKLLKAELRSLYAALGLLAPGTNTSAYEDILSNAAALDVRALAELADEATLDAVLSSIPSTNARISAAQYVGEYHRRNEGGRGAVQYLFDIVGLRERDVSAEETARMIPAGMAAFRDIFVRIGRAALLLREARAKGARTAAEITHDVVVAAASVDQFATVKAALETLFFLGGGHREAYEPWHMIAERGPDIMRLHMDFAKVQGETRVSERMGVLRSRAIVICASFNT